MIFIDDNGVRLTAAELNRLRQANAKNGLAVNRIESRDALLQAILDGLDEGTQETLAAFLAADDAAATSPAQ